MKFLVLFSYLAHLAISKTVKQEWTLKDGDIAPDNFLFKGILINDKFPGPQINAVTSDAIEIKVNNNLHKNVTIHWHGITQKGSIKADGVPYVTQEPIMPGKSYTYKFKVYDQSGTYFYHAHTDMDSEHIYGSLIIEDKKEVWDDIVKFNKDYKYDEDVVLLLSERWHKSTEELIDGMNNPPFRFPNQSQSILTNGRTYQKWGDKDDAESKTFNNGFSVTNVKPDKVYRLRLIAANGFSLFTFNIEGHEMTIIEADGTLVDPVKVDRVELSSGQRCILK
ncbi:hypothetical protein K502DRAFT_324364 [Neoconidiobolus thromboides FSU 785]|nr:hypothetical protein K502DRAFT_324364 [Neoconidiobolus thromboides FSU 785]